MDDLAAWNALRRAFGEVTEHTLRHDLLGSGLPLDPLVEGVRFNTMEEKSLWLRTRLENPELFAAWAPLRLQKVRNLTSGS